MEKSAYHFAEQDFSVFRQFDIPGTANQHLDRATWAKVGFEHILQTQRGIDIELQRLSTTSDFGLRIEQLRGSSSPDQRPESTSKYD